MEKEDDSSSKSSDDVFMNTHYFEMEDMGHWIDRNKEICTRWQEEKEFTMQLKDDVVLRDIFRVVIDKRERTEEEDVWLSSGMKTINRAFKNRFNMVCEVVREAKLATTDSDKDLGLDEVAKELNHVMIMMGQFQEEEGDFKFFYEQTAHLLREFVKWKTNLAKETTVISTQAENDLSSPVKRTWDESHCERPSTSYGRGTSKRPKAKEEEKLPPRPVTRDGRH
jgi:hypothetical protein